MGFFRQEHWSGLPFPPPGDLPNPGIELVSLELAGRFFTAEPPVNSRLPVISFQPQKLQRECIQSFSGYHAVENLFFNPEDCWTCFFFFFFFIADNSKLVWFHDINLGTYEEQRTLPCLEPRGTSTFSFPFLWRQYFFLLVGWCILLTFQGESVSDMQVIIKENQKKCNYKGQGTSSFLVWNAQRKI